MHDKSRFAILLLACLATLGASCSQPRDSPTLMPTLAPSATAVLAQVPTPTTTPNPKDSLEPVPTANSTPSPSPTQTPPSPSDGDISYSLRTPFVPLDTPEFLTAKEATYLSDDDLVLGVEWEGEARAYPIRMLTFHHIVNDEIAGRPFLVTY